jgi:predicted nuclease of predicted toxin-antitoxin system
VKRVLFDENMPRKLRRDLPEFTVRTVQEEGWAGYKNGELLSRAAAAFDVLVTADQRMRYQQHIPKFAIGVVVIEVVDTRLVQLRPLVPRLRSAIETIAPGEILIVAPD